MKKRNFCEKEHFEEILLVGNPNTGKTTLFNLLTKSNEHVGNWHGVTVEQKGKNFSCFDKTFRLVDLPGIYSLSALSYEEQVAIDYIKTHSKTKIINICDQNNIERNLSLTLGLLEYGLDIVLVVNCMDKRPLCKIDFKKLSDLLNIPVVSINAKNGDNINKLKKILLQPFKIASQPSYVSSLAKMVPFDLKVNNKEFYSIKLLEKDEKVCDELKLDLTKDKLFDSSIQLVANVRYDFIENIKSQCFKHSGKVYGESKIDKILLNRFLAFPLFLLILCGVFYLTFFSLGKWLSEALTALLDSSIGKVVADLSASIFGKSSWIYGLMTEALIGGVGTVLSFLPQVALLFLFLSFLEDSGYLSRVAFACEDIFGKLGLSGKSVYSLLMGFGCSTSAILTARNMDDKKAKIKTAMLTPYMSCSAKFPIYVVIGGAFFGANNVFVILGLYILGLIIALLLSLIYEKTILKSKEQSFILEFPPYRFGGVKRIANVLWDNIKTFLIRVGSLLIAMNVIVWLLANFSFSFSYVPCNSGTSMLESLGKFLAPIFIPLGFGSWGVASALIAGIVAKEVIISSIAMFNLASNMSDISASLVNPASVVFFASPSVALSFLVFCLLYCPCLSSMAVLKQEIGRKWTFFAVIVQFCLAYLTTLFVYNLALAFEKFGFAKVLLFLLLLILIVICILKVVSLFKKSRSCRGCNKCK